MGAPKVARYRCQTCKRVVPHQDVKSGKAIVAEEAVLEGEALAVPHAYCKVCAAWVRSMRSEFRHGYHEGLRLAGRITMETMELFAGLEDKVAEKVVDVLTLVGGRIVERLPETKQGEAEEGATA